MKYNLCFIIATGFFVGLFPIMPGTMGTLVAIPIYLITYKYHWYNLMVFLFLVIGFFICFEVAGKLHDDDPQIVVWDEVVGLLITLAFVKFSWLNLVMGFIIFRFFDITKILYIKKLEGISNKGIAIMADDVLAGIYSGLMLWVINFYFFTLKIS